ncbi:MAG: ABC transporter ATP-binding protein, partial [Clostridia bacterium]|nr:ABC transporter ATP-binding protein [Clostridia bacterium]
PVTASRVLKLTDQMVRENRLTTLMVTHNMNDALAYGNRLVMMDNGRVIIDIAGEEKKRTTVADLMEMFVRASGHTLSNDRMLLG